jgi:cell division protease FtsH
MVCEFGMSKALGPITYGKSNQEVFIGKDLMREKNYSEETAKKIDSEIMKIVDDAHKHATLLLKQHKRFLDHLAKTLMTKETIEGEEFEKIFKEFKSNNVKNTKKV